ncbi:hypothetical protein D3C75_1164320 [compost metagenome]
MLTGIIERPMPSPIIARQDIINGRPVSTVTFESMKSAVEIMLRPTNTNGRAPILSNRRPPSGIPIPEASACGSRIKPVSSGV